MDCHVSGAMLEAYQKLKTKPKTIGKLMEALQVYGATCHGDRSTFDKAVKDFSKRLKARFGAGSGHFEVQTFTTTIQNSGSDH